MTFAMIAAVALLGIAGQPNEPTFKVGCTKDPVYHWMIVPGGGVFPVPTPFMILVPLGKIDESLGTMTSRLRQELHIVIQSDKDGVITDKFARAVVEGLKHIIEEAQGFETCPSQPVAKTIEYKKSDPKQVIDPIVTGF